MSLSAALLVLVSCAAEPKAGDYFAISVVDDQTGRGVPLVELRTVDNVRYWTDSAGLVAFYEPGLMDETVFFHVHSHGYEVPADGFGYRGKALKISSGGSAELHVRRTNVAERRYRVTGAGIYRDSVLLGRPASIAAPLLNAQVAGSDSVNSAVYRGKIHWFWGDTNRVGYPLGAFHVPGATSRLPSDGGLDPARGVDLEYFQRDDGFVANLAEMPGDGPTWIDGLCVIRDTKRGERMFAKYVKVRKFLDIYERGLVEFKPERQRFEKTAQFGFAAPLYPLGHSFNRTVDGVDYVYFGNPYPLVRVREDAAALADPGQYEAFTCLIKGSRADKPVVERDPAGGPRYGWKRDTPVPTPSDEAKWLANGLIKTGEALLALRDVDSGQPIVAHAGSVAWNEYRKRWVMIVEQSQGTSHLGEIWFAEADTPVGPWVYARKIVTHEKYSFYNPKHHAMLDQQGGRRIFFEGTYSTFFSGAPEPTPRYDYNQIMYSLDLSDPRLALPIPVYVDNTDDRQRIFTGPATSRVGKIAFMALDRPLDDAVAIARRTSHSGANQLVVRGSAKVADVAFYALAAETEKPPATTLALFEWRSPNGGAVHYAIEGQPGPQGFVRSDKPLCRVWRCPIAVTVDWQ